MAARAPRAPIVGKGKSNMINPILEGRQYAKLGSNSVLEARPSIVHFGGFKLHRVHTQKIRVVNVSSIIQRLHVINPTTPYFKARYKKKGLIAPGMAEDITIEFEPNERPYYYDCVRVHCDAENLIIPIHAYPVMNDIIFPRSIDLGCCPLSETTKRVYKLECKVPIQFEFSLKMQKSHPDISISPMSGMIPANGSTEITVSFHPVSLNTVTVELQVDVSQFNFEPFICTLVGHSASGFTRENRIHEMQNEVYATLAPPELPLGGTMPAETGDLNSYAFTVNEGGRHEGFQVAGQGSGAAVDFGGAMLSKQRNRMAPGDPCEAPGPSGKLHKGTIAASNRDGSYAVKFKNGKVSKSIDAGSVRRIMSLKKPKMPAPDPDVMVEGLVIPAKIDGVNALQYVLTQQPGKLKPKDLRVAIDAQRAQRAQQKREQEELRAAQGTEESTPGSLTMQTILAEESGIGGDTTRQLKEMVFLQDLAEIEQFEKNCEFQSQRDRLGEPPLTTDEVGFLKQSREHRHLESDRQGRVQERGVFRPQAHGPYNVADAKRVSVPIESRPAHEPTFDPYTNDVWGMRKQILAKFIRAATTVIIRQRAARRLAKLQRRLAEAQIENLDTILQGRATQGMLMETRAATRKLVAEDNRTAAAAGNAGSAKGGKIQPPIAPAKVHRNGLVECPDGKGHGKARVFDIEPVAFNDVPLFKLNTPHEGIDTIGYTPHAEIPLRSFPEMCDGLVKLGASHESSILQPRVIAWEEPGAAAASAAAIAAEEEAAASDTMAACIDSAEQAAPKTVNLESFVAAEAVPALVEPLPSDPFSMLFHGSSTVGFAELLPRTELDPDYLLRPTRHARRITVTKGARLQDTMATGTLQALRPVETLSQNWKPRREGRASVSAGNGQQLQMWAVAGMPELATGPLADDNMSDSESDDDEDGGILKPSVELARSLFVDLAARAGGEEGEEAAEPLASARAEGGGEEALAVFRRDEQMLALEGRKLEASVAHTAVLRGRLEAIGEKVQQVRNVFTLEGHGLPVPTHQVPMLTEMQYIPQNPTKA